MGIGSSKLIFTDRTEVHEVTRWQFCEIFASQHFSSHKSSAVWEIMMKTKVLLPRKIHMNHGLWPPS